MFYRSILAAVAAIALASPVFADDTTTQSTTEGAQMQQSADTSSTATDTTSTSTETKVDLNKATAKELMKVKGLNAAKARAIVAYRKKHGEFKSIDDIANVKGFKKLNSDTMKEIQDQLTITN